MDWKKVYGAILYGAMKLYDISTRDLAEKTYSTETSVRYWRKGRSFPSESVLNYIYSLIERRIIKKNDISTNNSMVKLITDVFPDVETELQPSETFEKWVTAKLGLCYTYGNISRYASKPSFESTGTIRAVIFSFDGTLTNDFIANIWESIWVALGYTRKEFFDLYGSLDAKRILRSEWYKNITQKLMAKELHINSMLKLAEGIHLINRIVQSSFLDIQKGLKTGKLTQEQKAAVDSLPHDVITKEARNRLVKFPNDCCMDASHVLAIIFIAISEQNGFKHDQLEYFRCTPTSKTKTKMFDFHQWLRIDGFDIDITFGQLKTIQKGNEEKIVFPVHPLIGSDDYVFASAKAAVDEPFAIFVNFIIIEYFQKAK